MDSSWPIVNVSRSVEMESCLMMSVMMEILMMEMVVQVHVRFKCIIVVPSTQL